MLSTKLLEAAGNSTQPTYIEDVFVSWVSTGNGTSRTVTGPDMTAGGLSITKSRSAATGWHWVDTARGAGLSLSSNTTSAQATESTGVTAFTTTGTSIGSAAEYNTNGATYVDYLLKKQPKFFDVVTFTTNSSGVGTFSHNLGATPGCVLIKKKSGAEQWYVWHRSLTATSTQRYLGLNTTSAETNVGFDWISVSSTSCSVNGLFGTNSQYVAYLFAHNAGGFGLTGTDNVISCGSFTTDASGNATVTLGYEPQWVMCKSISGTAAVTDWILFDNMRGMPAGGGANSSWLYPNTSGAEFSNAAYAIKPTATGMNPLQEASTTYIYIAIRRGPMKVPTDGTKVFYPYTATVSSGTTITNGFPIDLQISSFRTLAGENRYWRDRLRGYPTSASSGTGSPELESNSTVAENQSATVFSYNWNNTGAISGDYPSTGGPFPQVQWLFGRAPGFFDEVCYTGTGVARTVNHNLGVAPELILLKCRNAVAFWPVYAAPLGTTKYLSLNQVNGASSDTGGAYWNNTSPTSSVFSLGIGGPASNSNGNTYVAYLFATCAGVSKVGSYTGTGTTQQINCGFTGGARFVLIKRTDSTGDWYVWDTARGIVSGNDPYLLMNSTAAEVTTTDYIDPVSSGFEISSTAPAAINASGGSYIYLAIA